MRWADLLVQPFLLDGVEYAEARVQVERVEHVLLVLLKALLLQREDAVGVLSSHTRDSNGEQCTG